MMELSYTLIADGPADRALIPILDWAITESGYAGSIQGECCDLRLLRQSPQPSLADKIRYGLGAYPCDLLFVHRDAERVSREKRVQEIAEALGKAFARSPAIPAVCVIPIRMTEAWLLFDAGAIRRAAGNPMGRQSLNLPPLSDLERLSKPKDTLHRLILDATGLSAGRRRAFRVGRCVSQVSQYIKDFTPLRSLGAFNALEADIRQVVSAISHHSAA